MIIMAFLPITVHGYFDSNALVINRHSDEQGKLYLSADGDNSYYVTIDSNNKIKLMHQSEITNVR